MTEAPIPCSKAGCPHSGVIATLSGRDADLAEWRSELRADIKEIKATLQMVELLKSEHGYQKESIGRAFNRLETLEQHRSDMQQFIARVDGMTRMAWALWTLLTGGLGLALFKLFQVGGA